MPSKKTNTRKAKTNGVTTGTAKVTQAKTSKADGSSSQAEQISSRLPEPNLSEKPRFPETTNGYVVGEYNRTGKTFVKADSGKTISTTVTSGGSRQVGQQALVKHDVTNAGSRVVITRMGVQIITQGGVGNTSNQKDQSDLDNCDDLGNPNNTPDEPDEPEEPEPPSEPRQPNPDDPDEPDELESPGEGCYPDDDCQWYNAGSGDASNCPSGTTYKGFAELTGGNFKVLCCGENRPAGDGCPDDPDTYGWQCVNGNCEQLPAGLFATKAECEASCNQDEPATPWGPDNGRCTYLGEGGSYATLQDCKDNEELGGQCEGVKYTVALGIKGGESGVTSVTNLYGPITALQWEITENKPNGDQVGNFIRAGFNLQGDPVSFSTQLTYGESQLPIVTVGPNRVDGQPDIC